MRPADTLIARLSGVKATGKGRWMAKCPAHEDGSPSLSIRELDDGRLLIHDFGGCDPSAVLQAVNLGLNDLFEGPLQRWLPPIRAGFSADELLISLQHESFVALTIIQAAQEATLTPDGLARLEKAVIRIGKARDLAYRR